MPKQNLRRATALFDIDWRPFDGPFVETLWRTRSVSRESFISTASSYWELCFWTASGRSHVTVRGPSTAAAVLPVPQDAEFFGIRFKPGTVLRPFPAASLVNRDLTLPKCVGHSFRLDSASWEIPAFENTDVFLDRLIRCGLLVRDPVVQSALQGWPLDLSRRTLQRRVKRSTGLSLGIIQQIERAFTAAALLDQGAAILDAVLHTGYADQAHLTRSVKRFIGQTPTQIASAAR